MSQPEQIVKPKIVSSETTPYLITLAVMFTVVIGGMVWIFSTGGTEATARVQILLTLAVPTIGALVAIIQIKATQVQVVEQAAVTQHTVAANHLETQATVAFAAAATHAEVKEVNAKVEQVAVQTDGKLTDLMNALQGKASAEGEIRGMAQAHASAATELLARADAASLLASQAPQNSPLGGTSEGKTIEVVVANPDDKSVPVRITPEGEDRIAEKVADLAAATGGKQSSPTTNLSIPATENQKVTISNLSVPVHITDEEGDRLAQKTADLLSDNDEGKKRGGI